MGIACSRRSKAIIQLVGKGDEGVKVLRPSSERQRALELSIQTPVENLPRAEARSLRPPTPAS